MNKHVARLAAVSAVLLIMTVKTCIALADYQVRISKTDLSVNHSLPEDVWNLLLIGTDTWEDMKDTGRSDTMIVLSYSFSTGEIQLVSLARDLLVEIPAVGQNRLNAAHSFGGPNLLMKTVNETFGLNITNYISVNIYGLRRIIDAMGGLAMHVTEREAERVHRMISIEFPMEQNNPCPSGDCVLSGLQAMTFARIRDLDNDFGRMLRQQTVLRAMAKQLMQLDETDRSRLVEMCLSQVSTNLTPADIVKLAGEAYSHQELKLSLYTLPERGTYVFENLNGMSVLLAETKSLQKDMGRILYRQ